MLVHLDPSNPSAAVIRSAMTLGTGCLLRGGEFLNEWVYKTSVKTLTIDSVQFFPNFENAQYAELTLEVSKTDIFRRGVTIIIYRGSNGFDPLGELTNMLLLRLKGKPFSSLDGSEPLFKFPDKRILTKKTMAKFLQTLASKCGWDPTKFKGHSFRRGGATSLANANVPGHIIQILGRWKSSAYLRYIQMSASEIANNYKKMCYY